MRILVLFMFLLLIVAVASFISLNQGKQINSLSLGFVIFPTASLNAVVLWSFMLGVMWALVIFAMQEIRLRIRIAKLKSAIGRLQQELDQLRTMPLSEIGIEDKEEQ